MDHSVLDLAVVCSPDLFSQGQRISDIYRIRGGVISRDILNLGVKNIVILLPKIELLLNVGLHLILFMFIYV
jgi:hypothetical protein